MQRSNLFLYFIHFNRVITKYLNIQCTLRKEGKIILREEKGWFLLVFDIYFSNYLQNIVTLCFQFAKFSWEKNMLGADEGSRMLFLHNERLLYIFKCNWNRETGPLSTKLSSFALLITKKRCCKLQFNVKI